ncbi:MAG: two-partner secretion domain-containing protein, partial [Planctomycetota bacterium]
MESVKRKVKGRYFRKAVVYFLTFCLISNAWLPAAMALEAGDLLDPLSLPPGVLSTSWGDDTTIGTDNGTIIDWSNFNTSSIQSVTFEQYLDGELNSMSAVLNRISSGAVPTEFNGALTANGRVFIVNPAGVMFGSTATVNVTQLIASSLNIENDDFITGKYLFAGDAIGEVANYGTINATEGAALIGKMVRNAGTIATDAGGFVVMAAGDMVLLGEPGSKIIVEMHSVTEGAEDIGNVINNGEITAPGGTVALAAGDIFSAALDVRVESGVGTVEQNGVINADGIDGDGGSVTLTAGDNVILTDGSLTTANGGISNAGANGGEVIASASELYAYQATVDFQAGAVIEVAGGEPVNPAAIDEGATFDGGLADISGDLLYFNGTVNATATPFDVPDPLNPGEFITITPDGGTLHIDPETLTLAEGGIPEGGAAMNTFYELELEAYSQAGVDTILEGDSGVTVEHIDDGEITGGTGDIVLRTAYNDGGIEFLPETEGDPITTTIRTTGGGNIFMLAGSGGIKTGDLLSYENGGNPGRIRIFTNNGGDIQTGALMVDGGNEVEVSIIASGDLVINGDVITNTNKVPAEYDQTGTANVCLVSDNGNINIEGRVDVEAHGKEETIATIHICADGTITVNAGNGRVQAIAKTSSAGTADAQVKIHAGAEGPDAITITRDAGDPIRVQANTTGASIGPLDFITSDFMEPNPDTYEQTSGGSHVFVQLADAWLGGCIDCPTPP